MMALLELLPSHSRNVSGSAGIGARGISSANQGGISGNQSFNFVGMNRSMVISTGSQCCPGGVLPLCCVEGKGVFSFNLNHIAPIQEYFGEGICDENAFITNLQFRTMNDQENKSSKNGRCNQSEDNVRDVRGYERLEHSPGKQGISNVRNYDCRCGSKTFNIGQSALSMNEQEI